MRIVLVIVATLLLSVLGVALVGGSLSARHRVSRSRTFPVPPEDLYAVLTDVAAFPTWRAKVREVDLVTLDGGRRGYRESGRDGVILFSVDEALPGRRLVTRIVNDDLPFGGTWTYELEPTTPAGGTILRITEDGIVSNPVFRFIARFVLSYYATIDAFLADLDRKVGETSRPSPQDSTS